MPRKNNKKFRKNPITQQARALEILWIRVGGPVVISRKLGFCDSKFNSWKRILGKVPLTSVGSVSRQLDISDYLLNYNEVFEFYGKGPSWVSVVKDTKLFNKEDIEYILQGKLI